VLVLEGWIECVARKVRRVERDVGDVALGEAVPKQGVSKVEKQVACLENSCAQRYQLGAPWLIQYLRGRGLACFVCLVDKGEIWGEGYGWMSVVMDKEYILVHVGEQIIFSCVFDEFCDWWSLVGWNWRSTARARCGVWRRRGIELSAVS
jgi:hypothetical protein